MGMLVDHSQNLADFADTAALLALMDQVVTVDTVLAHLGGAMARPTWTMLPFGSDYRWMTQGTTSPWYPTMRLFRQPALHDWGSVVATINQALDQDTQTGAPGAMS
jgi:ADP-heptose:LPS heptosyltransferase